MPHVDERTGLESLPEERCWDLLGQATVARLAVTVGTHPDIFPVNYVVRDGAVLIRTAPGTKLAAAVLNGYVALEIDGIDPHRHTGWSVVVHGTATEVEDLDGLLAAEASGLEPWADATHNRWLRIEPETVTGRRIAPR